jgi:hypothetical protein
MKDLVLMLIPLLTTLTKLLGPGDAKAVVADSLLMKQQLLVTSRSRKRAPNLLVLDPFLLGFWSLFSSAHNLDPRTKRRAYQLEVRGQWAPLAAPLNSPET